MKDFDWLTLVWAALVPAYSGVVALFPAQRTPARLAYLAGSLIWCVVIFVLIKRQEVKTRRERGAELAELRQIVRDEFAEAARIRNLEGPVLTPEAVDPSEHLRDLMRREKHLLGAYGIGRYGVGPYGGQDAWTIAAQNAAIRQQQIVREGDQDSLPGKGT
jgi:hypothetical protein